LRYDKDNRHTTDVADGTVRAKSFDHLQPKLTLTWKPVADQLLYASFGTGFRSGGFNAPGAPVDGFQAETLKNFEAGFKSQWFERTLTLNGAAFYTKVDNYQFFYVAQDPVTLAPSQVISNIAKVHIKGLELEVAALPMRGLQLALAVGYTDTIIDRSLIVSDEGNHVPRNMPFEATSSVQYRGPVSNTLSVFGRLELQYDSKKYWAPDNVSVQDGYTMLNARLGLERGDIGLYVFGKNLTNVATYSEYFDPKYSGSDISFGYHNPPRSYGVELKMKFGR
jgi:iron complex outermembrane recepter protein